MKSSEAQSKLLKEELLHSERLNALGQLAGGIAHDFNNQLAVIIGYAALLQGKSAADESSRQNVEQIFRAADRARSLIRQLLAFSRKQVLQLKVLDLSTVLRETRPMLCRLLPENIELFLEPSPEQQLVEMDEAQFEQVLLNLVVNARDAMPGGGVLTLKLSIRRSSASRKNSRSDWSSMSCSKFVTPASGSKTPSSNTSSNHSLLPSNTGAGLGLVCRRPTGSLSRVAAISR